MADEANLKDAAERINTPEGVTPDTVGKAPDQETKRGLPLFRSKLTARNFAQDIEARKRYARRLYRVVVIWLLFMAAVVLLQGFGGIGKLRPFSLEPSVLIALITSTTATVIGLFVIVTRYFFSHDERENPPDESE